MVWRGMSQGSISNVIYNITSVKDAPVTVNMDYLSGSLQSNVSVICLAHDWEVDVLASFYSLLYSFRGNRVWADKLQWILSRKGEFNVRSFYEIQVHKDNPPFPWKSIWQTKAPSKGAFFTWSAALGKILTMDNLRIKHFIVVNRCCMCHFQSLWSFLGYA